MTRVGASRIFFDVVAKWQSDKLIADMKTSQTIMQAVMLDVFDAVLGPMGDVGMMIDGMVSRTKDLAIEVGEARIAFEKFVSVDSRIALDNINESLIDMGHNFAMTASETFDAAARMAQMGAVIGETNILIGTQMGVMFSLISGMDTESAMRRITNLQQQTGFMYGEYSKETFKALNAMEQKSVLEKSSIQTLDALNTVENRSIATMEQLTFTMNQFASQAHLTGSSIEDMAAMSAVMIESGEQAGAAGRSLKMMYARLGGDIGGASTKLKEYGIDTKLANGDMKDMISIMRELKEKGWDQTTSANKQAIAQTIAGNRHYVRFIKLMEGYDRAVQLSAEATDGLASAQEEVNRRLEDPVVILEALNAEIEDYSAKIGTSLLPGITAAARAQRDYNAELLNFTSGEYGDTFASIANSLVKFREMTKITGGFLQLQLTIRAIIIGMGAFRSVMAAIGGQQIAIDSAFGSTRTTIQGSNMSLKEQKTIMKEIKGINDQITLLKSKDRAAEGNVRAAQQAKKYVEREILDMKQQEAAYTTLYGSELSLNFTKEKLRGQLLKNIGDEIRGHATAAATERSALMERTILLKQYGGTSAKMNTTARIQLATTHAQLVAEREIIQTQIIQRQFDEIALKVEANRAQAEQYTNAQGRAYTAKEIADLKKKWKEHQAITQQMEAQAFYMHSSIMDLDTHITKLKIYDRVEKEITVTRSKARSILDSTATTTGKMTALNELLRESNIKLSMAELRRTVTTGDLDLAMKRLETSMQKVILAEEKKNVAITKGAKAYGYAKTGAQAYSGGLMAISMLAPMIMGGQEGMRISMVATTLSMVPMIFTMGAATIAMMKTSLAALQLSAAMTTIVSVSGLLLAAAAVYYFADWIMGAESATDATTDFTNELMKMTSILDQLKGGTDYMLFEGVEKHIASSLGLVNYEIRELKENYGMARETAHELGLALEQALDPDTRDMLETNLKEVQAITAAHLDIQRMQYQGYIVGDSESSGRVMADAMIRGFGKNLNREEIHATWDEAFGPLGDLPGYGQMLSDKAGKGAFYGDLDMLFEADGDQAIRTNRRILGAIQGDFEAGLGIREQSLASARIFSDQTDDYSQSRKNEAKTEFIALKMLENAYKSMGKTLGDNSRPLDLYNEMLAEGSLGALAAANAILSMNDAATEVDGGLQVLSDDFTNLTEEMTAFGNAKDELFFGGKYGNVTGSLYKQVVTQGVGTLYNKQEVIMTNNFNGFFNEEEAAAKIISVLNKHMETGS